MAIFKSAQRTQKKSGESVKSFTQRAGNLDNNQIIPSQNCLNMLNRIATIGMVTTALALAGCGGGGGGAGPSLAPGVPPYTGHYAGTMSLPGAACGSSTLCITPITITIDQNSKVIFISTDGSGAKYIGVGTVTATGEFLTSLKIGGETLLLDAVCANSAPGHEIAGLIKFTPQLPGLAAAYGNFTAAAVT